MPQTNLGRVAFKFQGDYSALTTYAKYDVVFDGESSFVSQIDGNLGNALIDGLNWKYLAKGNNLGLQDLQQDVTDLETDLNGKINTTDVEQVRSQATNKVPSSKLFDDELTQVRSDLSNSQKVITDKLTELATDGKPLPFNSYIYDHYAKNNGILAPLTSERTRVYSVQSGSDLLLRWNALATNVNYGILFSNDPTFAMVESYLAPYAVTDGSKIITVPDNITYVAVSNGYLTLLDGRQDGVVDNNIIKEISSIRSDFNGYTPTLEFYGMQVGYLSKYGLMTQTQSGSSFRYFLYSVTPGQVFYFKQDIAEPYAYFGFCDDANISHIISYSASEYGKMVRVVVPDGANYFIVNGMTQGNGTVPDNVYCLGEPKLNIGFVGTPVYNYFPAYSLNENNIVLGNKGGIDKYIFENIATGEGFKDKGTLKYFTLDLTTQKLIFGIDPSLFRTQFKTTGKLRVVFDVLCEYQTGIDIRLYTWGATPLYISKSVTTTQNKIVTFDYTFEVAQAQIANITNLELYIFKTSSTARTIKVANVIVTDDIFEKAPYPYFSRDWNIITRPISYLYKTCIYIGDSISTANNYGWKKIIEDTYTIKYVRDTSGLNPANGGRTIRPSVADESSLPDSEKSIWYRCANARMGRFNFDIINLFGGQNDKGVVASNLLGTINDKPFVDDVNTFNNPTNYTDVWTNTLTFAQCYMGCIEMLKRDFPTNKLLLMSIYPTRNDADNIEQMAILQCQIAYKYNLEITPLFWNIFRISSVEAFTRDGVHPNTVLARQMSISFAKTLGI